MAMTNEEIFRRAGVKTAKALDQERLDAPVTRRDVQRWVRTIVGFWLAWKLIEWLLAH